MQGIYIFVTLRPTTSVRSNFVYFTRKNLIFLFYTSTFTKHSHQFIYSTLFYNFLLFTLLLPLFLTDPQSITTNDHSTPSHHHHHHHHPTSVIKKNQPTQSETHSIPNSLITHPTWNLVKPNHYPPNRQQDHQNPPMNQKKHADQDQNPPIKIFNLPIKIPANINPINTHRSIPIKTHTSRPWELRHDVVFGSRASEIVPSKLHHSVSELRHNVVCLLRSYWRWVRLVRVRSVAWGEIGGLIVGLRWDRWTKGEMKR